MPDWATALIAVHSAEDEPFVVVPGRGRVLAHSALLHAGYGSGHLWLLDRGAWEEALAAAAGERRQARAVRVWDALVGASSDPPAERSYLSTAVDLGTSALDFDDPAVAGAIKRALAAYLPLLGSRFIATSTLMSDWRRCCGALTAFSAGSEIEAGTLATDDPWWRIFPGRLFRLEHAILGRVSPPAGPNTQRYGGANPWPGGRFG